MKIKKVTARGTGTKKVEVDEQKWAGEKYREIQKQRKEAAKNRFVHMGRGTGSKRLGDLPDPKPRPSIEGITRVVGRGTRTVKSKKTN